MKARIDGRRLLARIDAMAASAPAEGSTGVTRLAWTPVERAGRDLATGWLADAGVATETDAAGNLVATWDGTEPGLAPIVTGSHLDTVVEGGALDGAYGTLAGFEVVTALAGAGVHLRHPVKAVAWANEEGVVAPPFTGSLAAAGAPIDVRAIGPDGATLGDRMRAGGGDPDRIAGATWDPIAAYIELHIEQGPILDAAGGTVGVVTGITGLLRGTITVTGRANHAGTTPMHLRHDALIAAVPFVTAVADLATTGPADAATVGSLVVRPGNANVVPGQVVLTYDIRSIDDARSADALALLTTKVKGIAEETGTEIALSPTSSSRAVLTDPVLRSVIHEAAAVHELTTAELASGAGHDAQHVAALGPMGMIFVPSIGGVSHNPAEATASEHLVAGAETLLTAILIADTRLER